MSTCGAGWRAGLGQNGRTVDAIWSVNAPVDINNNRHLRERLERLGRTAQVFALWGRGGCVHLLRASPEKWLHTKLIQMKRQRKKTERGKEIGQTHLDGSCAARGPRRVPRARAGGSENPGMPFWRSAAGALQPWCQDFCQASHPVRRTINSGCPFA